jgi:hypothetical protein
MYPETANLRLEDMDQLFGDATTAMPTPAQEAEVESLMSASRSPVPSLDLRRRGNIDPESGIPGLNINPADAADSNGKKENGESEGIGGWISKMVSRGKNGKGGSGESGSYRQLGQDEA